MERSTKVAISSNIRFGLSLLPGLHIYYKVLRLVVLTFKEELANLPRACETRDHAPRCSRQTRRAFQLTFFDPQVHNPQLLSQRNGSLHRI